MCKGTKFWWFTQSVLSYLRIHCLPQQPEDIVPTIFLWTYPVSHPKCRISKMDFTYYKEQLIINKTDVSLFSLCLFFWVCFTSSEKKIPKQTVWLSSKKVYAVCNFSCRFFLLYNGYKLFLMTQGIDSNTLHRVKHIECILIWNFSFFNGSPGGFVGSSVRIAGGFTLQNWSIWGHCQSIS